MKAVLRRSVALVAVALLAAACTSGGPTTASAPSGPVLVVDQGATPKGWVPVDYGDLQVSVPAGWKVSYEAYCQLPKPPGTVFVGPPAFGGTECPVVVGQGEPEAYLGPAAETTTDWSRQNVNGVLILKPPPGDLGESDYFVPSLGLLLRLTGSEAQSLLATLTYSPRAAVLSGGSMPSVPSSWRSDTFAGLTFAAPASWPQYTPDGHGPGRPALVDTKAAAAARPSDVSCPGTCPTATHRPVAGQDTAERST